MAYEPKTGDLVWSKMRGYTPWPSRVMNPPPGSRGNKKGHHWIYFFGSKNFAWIEDGQIKPYEKFKAKFETLSSAELFKFSIKDIKTFIEKKEKNPEYEEEFDRSLEEKQLENKNKTPAKSRKSKNDFEDEFDRSLDHADTGSEKSADQPAPKKARKSGTKRRNTGSPAGDASAKRVNTSSNKSRASASPNLLDENGTSAEETYEEEISNLPPGFVKTKPESPSLDLANVPEDLKSRDVQACKETLGFMGLGNMGSSVVTNLINSGHRVNLFNRTPSKCEEIKSQADASQLMRVETYEFPCDLLRNSDIIFSCLSDPRAAKEIVVGNCGVIQAVEGFDGTLSNKGYVEMTSIDPETSKDICNMIESRGGRYLEVQMQGSKKQAEEGNLIILAAGDKTLFEQCQPCFKAIGKTAFYLGKVGNATRMNLCLNMAAGISLAGLAESMVLAERCGLSCKDFLEIYKKSECVSSYLLHKGQLINERKFNKVEQALQYMQKDLKFCLDISNDVKQNLPVAAATNEAYKTCRRSGYDAHDVAIVYMKMKH